MSDRPAESGTPFEYRSSTGQDLLTDEQKAKLMAIEPSDDTAKFFDRIRQDYAERAGLTPDTKLSIEGIVEVMRVNKAVELRLPPTSTWTEILNTHATNSLVSYPVGRSELGRYNLGDAKQLRSFLSARAAYLQEGGAQEAAATLQNIRDTLDEIFGKEKLLA